MISFFSTATSCRRRVCRSVFASVCTFFKSFDILPKSVWFDPQALYQLGSDGLIDLCNAANRYAPTLPNGEGPTDSALVAANHRANHLPNRIAVAEGDDLAVCGNTAKIELLLLPVQLIREVLQVLLLG